MSGTRKPDDEALKMFRKAVDHLMRRMVAKNELRFLLHGTEAYAKLLHAYAASNGAELSEMPELDRIEAVWEALHKPEAQQVVVERGTTDGKAVPA